MQFVRKVQLLYMKIGPAKAQRKIVKNRWIYLNTYLYFTSCCSKVVVLRLKRALEEIESEFRVQDTQSSVTD